MIPSPCTPNPISVSLYPRIPYQGIALSTYLRINEGMGKPPRRKHLQKLVVNFPVLAGMGSKAPNLLNGGVVETSPRKGIVRRLPQVACHGAHA